MTVDTSQHLSASFISPSGFVSTLLSSATLGLLIYYFSKWYSTVEKQLPPGPWGLPVLGHLPFIGPHPHRKFSQWANTYGSVFAIRMGSRLTVVISGYKAIKQALVNQSEDFAARPDFVSFQYINDGKSVSFGKYGPQWKTHKTIARNALSLFTQKRKRHLENQVVDEADTIIDELLSVNGAVDPQRSLHVATAAIIFSICFEDGHSIRENKKFLEVLSNSDEFVKTTAAGSNPADLMPWAQRFLKGRMRKFIEYMDKFTRTNKDAQENLRNTWISQEPRNLTDALFDILEDTGEQKLKDAGLDRDRILFIADDVLGAGQATVTSFLYWALLYMIEFPDVQRCVHDEIDRELGGARSPTYEDRLRMPYCEAVFFETLRYSIFVPFLLPHAASRDCTFLGYDIPKGTLAFFNVASISNDTELWAEPSVFDPTRFIDPSTGQMDRDKSEQVIMFGLGKRRCLGEFLGRLESFVFFVRLLQRCEFSKVEGEHYTLDGIFGLTYDATPYKLRVRLR